MRFHDACIPIQFGWSSPFARWQTAFADVSSLDLAVQVTRRALDDRGLLAAELSRLIFGTTTPQRGGFYAAPTVAARIGAERVSGPTIAQACATSAACVETAALYADADPGGLHLVVAADRTSNSPVLTYPSSSAPGGAPDHEHWFFDNIRLDPWAGKAMIETAERVAGQAGITREQADEMTLLRYEQYTSALAADRAFQRRWMVPVEVPRRRASSDPQVVDADVGVHDTTAEGLAKLDPVLPGGVVTYGSQTHPADGTAGVLVTGANRARELAAGGPVARVLASGIARVEPAEMPKAPVPAAQRALADAELTFADVAAVTTHNPFAVNDVWFARETGFDVARMNQRGSSLIFGHPNGPTGARLLVELIHTLVDRGGGVGLFSGCAAGDTAAALVVRVDS
jgi:acetyl-CoA C-acetyltransferase